MRPGNCGETSRIAPGGQVFHKTRDISAWRPAPWHLSQRPWEGAVGTDMHFHEGRTDEAESGAFLQDLEQGMRGVKMLALAIRFVSTHGALPEKAPYYLRDVCRALEPRGGRWEQEQED